ncbi:uncharacterized protein E0L32_008240 [Thyridium curvatum]|uniref:EXPERA domain-containing protein n=1 Tax=Thyridium curvatum TaxID=1093900 RepID=A0A507B146_9PEZI|nr:uncharacterized protein E0L32_008240 [Thyridium curvatum]TPX10851.1 hypothetical protein E0L32_008240 [Thyridium curvatum]
MGLFDYFAPQGANVPPAVPSHPYYPPGVPMSNYQANVTPLPVVLASFGGLIGVTVVSALLGARKMNNSLGATDQLLFCWFILCFFVLNHESLAGSQHLLAQAWKEYALSDSRYLTSDPFTVCVETITALVWGPCCLATAACIVRGRKSAGGLRQVLQIVTSLAHLYGVALYYSTCHFEYVRKGLSYSRPEPLYYWVYYVGFNAPWVVVPAGQFVHFSHFSNPSASSF